MENTHLSNRIKTINDCLAHIRLEQSANVLDLNENKTEVIVFSPDGHKDHGLDLLSLSPFQQSVVTNLGVRLDAALKLNLQINVVTRSCFSHLRRLAGIESFLSKPKLQTSYGYMDKSHQNECLIRIKMHRVNTVRNALPRSDSIGSKFPTD